jgi:hypothetical protein
MLVVTHAAKATHAAEAIGEAVGEAVGVAI